MKQLSVPSCQLPGYRDKSAFICLTILFLIPLFLSIISSASAASVDELVSRIQKKYAEVHDIQGVFYQINDNKDMERRDTYSAKFYIKKPSRMRWEYGAPRDEEVLISGDEMWIYQKSEKTVGKVRFSKDAYNIAPIAMLQSMENLKVDYEIKMTAEDTLELVPRQQMGSIKSLRLTIDPGDFPIKTLAIFNLNGNSNVFHLKDVKINPGLEDSFFIFEMPSGAELFDYSR